MQKPQFRSMRLLAAVLGVVASSVSLAMSPLQDDELSAVTGQALLVANKLAGATGYTEQTFYRMMLDAKLEMNMNIDSMRLGCGGYNEVTAANSCDIDIDYIRMMGRGGGQPGAPGAGEAVTSTFKMVRPYLDIAVKNDGSATTREIIGIKIGSAVADGYMGIGQYNTSLPGCNPAALDGEGAFDCHRGVNRLSGNLNLLMNGQVFGCFAIFGCSVDGVPPEDQDLVATIDDQLIPVYGTRLNRVIAEVAAASADLPVTLNSGVNQHLRMSHGMAIDPTDAQYLADDFFMSFQRERVRWPTSFGKSTSHSREANPGWWFNIPLARLDGLKVYGLEASAGSLFAPPALTDPDIGQRPPDNCYGSLTFC